VRKEIRSESGVTLNKNQEKTERSTRAHHTSGGHYSALSTGKGVKTMSHQDNQDHQQTQSNQQILKGREKMTAEEKIALNERNIRQALADYGKHTRDQEVLEDVGNEFIHIVARDNYYAKMELRELFRKSPAWNEELDAIVINGTHTHDPDYDRVFNIAYEILSPAIIFGDNGNERKVILAIRYFSAPTAHQAWRQSYEDALTELAPGALAPGKKLSKVFRDLCKALGVADESAGSEFQKLYAQFADEIQSKQIPYKLFVSINPAHWITMSNPKRDTRGETLKSCHSFNSTDYSYNNGCSGYARDKYSFICFTVKNPNDAESLNNRKTTRQVFVYKPGSGVLLQSRMYNTNGGTVGAQAESKEYRDLIQRELSALEGATNLWNTQKYHSQSRIYFTRHELFGGYPDWEYSDYVPMVSVRTDASNPEGCIIGAEGVCIKCGEPTSYGVYCDECANGGIECDECANGGIECDECANGGIECEDCGDHFDEDEMTWVYDHYGNRVLVCPRCLDRHYTLCADCGEYFPDDDMTQIGNGNYVCESCLVNYTQCDYCGDYGLAEDMHVAVDRYGNEVWVCEACADWDYDECEDCGRLVRGDDATQVYGSDGEERTVCPSCLGNYTKCDICGEYHKDDHNCEERETA
jgi:hypothetical protein